MVVRGFSTSLLASLLLMAGGAGDSARLFAQNAPPQTQGQIGGQTNGDRLGTLEMRLMQLEQLVAAQNTLTKRQRMTDLTALVKRLEALEARLAGGAPIAVTAQENTAPAIQPMPQIRKPFRAQRRKSSSAPVKMPKQ